METNEMEPGTWDEGGQALEEFQRRHDEMGGAVAVVSVSFQGPVYHSVTADVTDFFMSQR